MKKLIVSALALAAACAYGQMMSATGDRLADYTTWFAGFDPASDDTYLIAPYPSGGEPAQFTEEFRAWSGWNPNWGGTDLAGPLVSDPPPPDPTKNGEYKLKVELVFLGETAGWWDDLGVNIDGTPMVLADSIQTIGGSANRQFGDYAEFWLEEGQSFDFFVTGTEIEGMNPGLTIGDTSGGLYYALDQSLNEPSWAIHQSYWGLLEPMLGENAVGAPFTIVAFEDIRQDACGCDADYNDLLVALRSSYDYVQGPVPEPSTYGLIGAGALLLTIGCRRLRKSR